MRRVMRMSSRCVSMTPGESMSGVMASGRDFWLKPGHASPLPLQRRGVRRAKALFCQDIAFPVLRHLGFGGKMHPEDRAQGQQRICRQWLETRWGPRRAVLSDSALIDSRAGKAGRDIMDKAFAERSLGPLTKEFSELAHP